MGSKGLFLPAAVLALASHHPSVQAEEGQPVVPEQAPQADAAAEELTNVLEGSRFYIAASLGMHWRGLPDGSYEYRGGLLEAGGLLPPVTVAGDVCGEPFVASDLCLGMEAAASFASAGSGVERVGVRVHSPVPVGPDWLSVNGAVGLSWVPAEPDSVALQAQPYVRGAASFYLPPGDGPWDFSGQVSLTGYPSVAPGEPILKVGDTTLGVALGVQRSLDLPGSSSSPEQNGGLSIETSTSPLSLNYPLPEGTKDNLDEYGKAELRRLGKKMKEAVGENKWVVAEAAYQDLQALNVRLTSEDYKNAYYAARGRGDSEEMYKRLNLAFLASVIDEEKADIQNLITDFETSYAYVELNESLRGSVSISPEGGIFITEHRAVLESINKILEEEDSYEGFIPSNYSLYFTSNSNPSIPPIPFPSLEPFSQEPNRQVIRLKD